MRPMLIGTVIALVVAGCGQTSDRPAAEPLTTKDEVTTTKDKVTESDPPAATAPPDIALVSAAGRQVGSRGAYCVMNQPKGVGLCTDTMAVAPKALSVVRPGETIRIALDEARAVRSQSCHNRDLSCIGEVQVNPFGCPNRMLARVFLERGPETTWRAALEPGAYELRVFVYFETDDGRSGDTSGALGLLVEPGAAPEIVPAETIRTTCR